MKTFKVSIYPQTNWVVRVEAENEEEAKTKALALDGPAEYSFLGDDTDEWHAEIWEWPNIGPEGQVDVEEDE
jgi:hypothetical protein